MATDLVDVITGRRVPDVGAEANRQLVERILLDRKGFRRDDIAVDVDLELMVAGEPYRTQIDLVVAPRGHAAVMVIKCAAGSLGSRERETLAAARLLSDRLVPLAVVSDGRAVVVLDTASGKRCGRGWDAVPCREAALDLLAQRPPAELAAERREREKLIFRSYDSMNVNVQRNVSSDLNR